MKIIIEENIKEENINKNLNLLQKVIFKQFQIQGMPNKKKS